MRLPVICNDPPYGTERSWNGARLARSLAPREDVEVRVFLKGDAVGCAVAGLKLPDGHYHLDRVLGAAVRRGGGVGRWGTRTEARGIRDRALVEGAHGSCLQALTDWTLWAGRKATF